MARHYTIRVPAGVTAGQVHEAIARAVARVVGRAPPSGASRTVLVRIGLALLGKIHGGFESRSKGQTADGLRWEPLAEGAVKAKCRRQGRRGRPEDILVGSGELADSLKPGSPPEAAGPTPPSVPGQVFRVGANDVTVGTRVPHGVVHHQGDPERGLPERRLWPEPEDWPASCRRELARQGARALAEAIVEELRGLRP
jgi:hypothetical protein